MKINTRALIILALLLIFIPHSLAQTSVNISLNQPYTATIPLSFTSYNSCNVDNPPTPCQLKFGKWFILNSKQNLIYDSGWSPELTTSPYIAAASFTPTAIDTYYLIAIVTTKTYTESGVTETIESKEAYQLNVISPPPSKSVYYPAKGNGRGAFSWDGTIGNYNEGDLFVSVDKNNIKFTVLNSDGDERFIKYKLPNNNDVSPERNSNSNSLTWKKAYPDVDVRYDMVSHGIKMFISGSETPITNIFRFPITTSGQINFQLSSTGYFAFDKKTGEYLFTILYPTMHDGNGRNIPLNFTMDNNEILITAPDLYTTPYNFTSWELDPSTQSGSTIYIGDRQNLTEVSADIANSSALQDLGGGEWLLNANLINNNTANSFYLNSSDVTWLKINSTHTAEGNITWYYLTNGKTEINNTKITSWNTTSNTVESLPVASWARSAVYASDALSKMNISNSNVSYLGYNAANMWGIVYTSSSGNQIINNSFLQNYGGILLSYSSYNTLISNNCTSTLSAGIYLESSSNYNTLVSNNGTSYSSIGILVSSSSNNNLTSNTGTSNTSYGVWLSASSNNNLTSNTGTSNANIGIYLSASSNNNLTSNTGTSNTDAGIRLESSSNNNLTSNTGTSTSSYGIFLRSSSNNNLTSNTGTSTSSYGILLYSSSNNNTLISNTGTSNTGQGIRLDTSSNNNTLISNTGTSNTGQGILLLSSSNNNTLTSNTGTSNTNFGIYLESSSNNNLTSNTFNTNSTSATIEDIVIDNSGRNNTFINTNFANPRKIEFNDALLSEFNQSQDGGISFVNTNVSIAQTTNRSIVNWTQSNITFTETFTGATKANYSVTGLLPSVDYKVYNGTANDFNLTTDAAGILTPFTINFSTSATTVKILQQDFTLPTIDYISPTDTNGTTVGRNYTFINTSVSDTGSPNNLTGLINFDNSLVGWWRFNEASGTTATDYSGYGNTGTLTNMNTGLDNGSSGWNSSGKFGNAISFDGVNDYVNVGNTVSLNITNTITIDTWIKPNDLTSYHIIVSKSDATFTGTQYELRTNGASLEFLGSYGTGTPIATKSGLNINSWNHVIGTYINNTFQVYINGVNGTSATLTGTKSTTSVNVSIGIRKPSTPQFYFNGTIDEVRIYNRALSTEEINASYNTGLYHLYHNFTGLSDGEHNYTAYVQDLAGNVNSTTKQYVTVDAIPPAITLTDYYGLDSNGTHITTFNTTNLAAIEKMQLNFSIANSVNITGWYFNFTANGTRGCSLGNEQSSNCYNYSNAYPYQWIQFINNTNTSTFDGTDMNTGDYIHVNQSGSGTSIYVNLTIDEHYNPNVFKWYDARYNFSDVKWQTGTNQRITKNNLIKVTIDHTLVPMDADQYKLDFRANYSTGSKLPTQRLRAFACSHNYTTGDPDASSDCAIIAAKYPADFQDDGTKFRGIFTKNLTDQIGDIDYIILATAEPNPTKYYYIKTYKADASPYTTHWEYSNDLGTTWTNSADGYETELNINWFYDGLTFDNKTAFVYQIFANTSATSNNTLLGNISWNINAVRNYPPLANIMTPVSDESLTLPYNITFDTADPNNNVLNVSLMLYYTNETLYQTLITGMTASNKSYLMNGASSGDYRLRLWANETGTTELYNVSSIRNITIDVSPPTAVTLLTPTNGDHTNDNTPAFDWTDATDTTSFNYTLQIANDTLFADITQNITSITPSTYTLTTPLSDGDYYWRVRATDIWGNIGNWSAEGYFNVTIDTVNPDWILTNYPKADNTTKVTNSITWDAKVYDTNLYRISLNVTNATGYLMESNYTEDWNSSWYNFTHTTDVSGWARGNYTVELSATDDHTNSSTDLNKGKKGETILVFNSSSSNTEISASFVEKQDKPTDTPGTFKSNISELINGHYKFGYNFTVIKPETKLILNITSNKKLKYRTSVSRIQGHFVWDNKYYMDFADVPNTMNVTVTKITDYNYKIRIEGKTQWTGNQKIVIDPVAGGLNTQTEYYNILLNSNPILNTIGDKSADEYSWLNFTVSASDANNDTLTYGTNATKGTFNTSTGNFNWSVSDVDSGTYHWYFNVSDSYGGTDNETILVTINNIEAVSAAAGGKTTGSSFIPVSPTLEPTPVIIPSQPQIVSVLEQFIPSGSPYQVQKPLDIGIYSIEFSPPCVSPVLLNKTSIYIYITSDCTFDKLRINFIVPANKEVSQSIDGRWVRSEQQIVAVVADKMSYVIQVSPKSFGTFTFTDKSIISVMGSGSVKDILFYMDRVLYDKLMFVMEQAMDIKGMDKILYDKLISTISYTIEQTAVIEQNTKMLHNQTIQTVEQTIENFQSAIS